MSDCGLTHLPLYTQAHTYLKVKTKGKLPLIFPTGIQSLSYKNKKNENQ